MRTQLRILVVAQDADAQKLVSGVLLEQGIEPHCAANVQEVATAVEHEKFDGVFVGRSTLLREGEKISQLVRNSHSNAKTPIIAFLGQENGAGMKQAYRAGATFLVPMPADSEGIRRVLRAAQGAMLEEHRRYHRVPVMTRVRCRWGNKEVEGTSWNLSTGGMFVNLEDPPPPRSSLVFEFQLPGTRAYCRLKGKVVRVVAGRGMGVKFDPTDWMPQNSLHRFIEQTQSTLT